MDSQVFQYEFQRVSSCSAWCCCCSRRRDRQMRPRESARSKSRFSDQSLHGLHSKLQSNTMNIEDIHCDACTISLHKRVSAGFKSWITLALYKEEKQVDDGNQIILTSPEEPKPKIWFTLTWEMFFAYGCGHVGNSRLSRTFLPFSKLSQPKSS